MKKPLFTLTIILALSLSACDRDSSVPEAISDGADIFNYVPADTPYLMATLEGVPDDIVVMSMEASRPFIDDFQKVLNDASLAYDSENENENNPFSSLDKELDFNIGKFYASLLEQYSANYSIEGMRNLGLDPNSKSVVYGLGPFPVIRMTILDEEKIRVVLDKAFTAAGETLTEKELNGRKYWQFGGEKITGIASIGQSEVSIGVIPSSMLDEGLANILGQSVPAEAMDVTSELAKFNRSHGYTNYGTGWLKPERFLNIFLSDTSTAANSLRDLMKFDNSAVTGVCKDEVTALVATVPMIHMGTKKLDKSEMVLAGTVELEAGLASELQQLTIANTLNPGNPGSLLNIGFAMDLAKLREWLLSTAKKRNESPYQCAELAGLNSMYATAYQNLNQPLPPLVGNLFGFKVSIDDLDFGKLMMGGSPPENGKLLLSILTSNPEMLVGMRQMFLPDLAGLNLTSGGDPVELNLAAMPTGDEPAWAAMGDSSLGVAIGEGMDSKLPAFLSDGESESGEFLTIGMDSDLFLELQNSIIAMLPDDVDISDSTTGLEVMIEMYESMFFKSSLTDKGITFESQYEFKQD